MKCINCGNNELWNFTKYKIDSIPTDSIPDYYKGYTWVPQCGKCGFIPDYKDLSTDDFFNWLNTCDEDKKTSENLKGKALIRYFELDKLLESKKDVGD